MGVDPAAEGGPDAVWERFEEETGHADKKRAPRGGCVKVNETGTNGPQNRSAGQKCLLLVGSIGPLGHMPASGTVAVAVAGVPLAWLMRENLSLGWYLAVSVVFTLFAIWLHDVGDRLLGEKDSRKLVLDELAGFWFAVVIVPLTWQMFVIAFFAERFIDIAKVPPANIIERRVPGGAGVVLDDVVAGIYTLLLLLAVETWVPAHLWGG